VNLSGINLSVDSIWYEEKEINATIRNFSLKERSGLEITSFTGMVKADSSVITIPELLLKTPYSEARFLASIPWNSLNEQPKDNLRALFSAFIGKEDILLFTGIPQSSPFVKTYPGRELTLTAGVEGNMSALNIQQMKAELEGAFSMNASGKLYDLTDSLRRSGNITLQASTGDLAFILNLLDSETRSMLNLPQGMTLTGRGSLKNRAYETDLLFTESAGKVALSAHYDLKTDAYGAILKVDSLEPVHFMPQDSLLWLTAFVEAQGKGTDVFSKRTHAELKGNITDIRYGSSSVSDVALDGTFKEHQFNVELNSHYPLAEFTLSLSGMQDKDKLEG